MSDRRARRKVYAGPVNVLPKYMTDSDELRSLPPSACKLLLALLPQFNGRGRNNGSLMILMRQPRRYGFSSVETLSKARDDLLRHGFIQVTRQGGRHQPNLYAFTWEPVDNVPGLDVRSDTKPSDLWRRHNAAARETPSPVHRKNKIPAPISGTQTRATAPISGTQLEPIAPIIGAVRGKNGNLCVPKTGTDLCIAMGGVPNVAPVSADAPTKQGVAGSPLTGSSWFKGRTRLSRVHPSRPHLG